MIDKVPISMSELWGPVKCSGCQKYNAWIIWVTSEEKSKYTFQEIYKNKGIALCDDCNKLEYNKDMSEEVLDKGEQKLMDYCEQEILKSMFEKKSILNETTRLTIRVDDVSIGMSVKKRDKWTDEDIADVLEEVVRMLRSPELEDKEIF